MCGRYYIDDETMQQIEKLVRHLDQKLKKEPNPSDFRSEVRLPRLGDIYPSQQAPVITGCNEEFSAELFTWGFPGFDKKNLIINARSETVLEKRSFKDSIQKTRCAIPVSGFYEWNQRKEKYTFTRPDGKGFYLAGFHKKFDGEERFVILTTEANDSMKGVHSRMPLILEESELKDWIFDDSKLNEILKKVPDALEKETEYEQQTFDFLDE